VEKETLHLTQPRAMLAPKAIQNKGQITKSGDHDPITRGAHLEVHASGALVNALFRLTSISHGALI
jgi:hypothetical protein